MTDTENRTLDYYNQNSQSFTGTTLDVEFSEIQDTFLSYLQEGAYILDFGCGSGRDTRYFLKKGYRVDAMDGSEEMVKIASANTGIEVKHMLFGELNETEKYDGIFACASILHVKLEALPDIMTRMYKALKNGGVIYVSFKYGDFEGERNGRYFTDMNEERFNDLLKEVPAMEILKETITSDVRPGRADEKWLNVFLRKPA
ncbi:MAG: class I SAM-dependent methyltransferase [Solobacterium sp.]|nr:class I SAM-dependent methyltransferase [Solobacterium sp.]